MLMGLVYKIATTALVFQAFFVTKFWVKTFFIEFMYVSGLLTKIFLPFQFQLEFTIK